MPERPANIFEYGFNCDCQGRETGRSPGGSSGGSAAALAAPPDINIAPGLTPPEPLRTAIKRTDLLKTALPEMEGKDMNVWVADIPPNSSTGRHSHPTPRFVYVLEGAVVYEVDGKPPQTFRAGEAYAEMPGEVHNFRNASSTQPAKALGFQYANKGQPLQTNAP
jgi:quercetin dioxygenase-like cupin family protein